MNIKIMTLRGYAFLIMQACSKEMMIMIKQKTKKDNFQNNDNHLIE